MAAAAALLLAGTGMAVAAIPDPGTGVIHGCYSVTSGALRVVDVAKGQRCKSGEAALTWNQRGLSWRGSWNGSAPYARNDVVFRGGSSYIAVRANRNVAPPQSSYWAVLALAGATGAQGPGGAVGATGASGSAGLNGARGTNGNTILNGAGSPSDAQGTSGDFYLDTSTYTLWGPKGASAWPATGQSLRPPPPAPPPTCPNVPTVTAVSTGPVVPDVGDLVQLSASIQSPTCPASPAPFTYDWVLLSKPSGSHAVIDFPTDPTPSFVPDVVGTYDVGLRVTDSYGTASAPYDRSVTTSTCGRNAPVVGAITKTGSPVVQLILPTPTDADNTTCAPKFPSVTFSYSWQLLQTPAQATTTVGGATYQNAWLDLTGQPAGAYTVQVTVSASNGTAATEAVVVNWNGSTAT